MSVKFKIGDTIAWNDPRVHLTGSIFKITDIEQPTPEDCVTRYLVTRVHSGDRTSIAVVFADQFYRCINNGVRIMLETL
jgi:hypothetical protein